MCAWMDDVIITKFIEYKFIFCLMKNAPDFFLALITIHSSLIAHSFDYSQNIKFNRLFSNIWNSIYGWYEKSILNRLRVQQSCRYRMPKWYLLQWAQEKLVDRCLHCNYNIGKNDWKNWVKQNRYIIIQIRVLYFHIFTEKYNSLNKTFDWFGDFSP